MCKSLIVVKIALCLYILVIGKGKPKLTVLVQGLVSISGMFMYFQRNMNCFKFTLEVEDIQYEIP